LRFQEIDDDGKPIAIHRGAGIGTLYIRKRSRPGGIDARSARGRIEIICLGGAGKAAGGDSVGLDTAAGAWLS
jgi:hypothetical protein